MSKVEVLGIKPKKAKEKALTTHCKAIKKKALARAQEKDLFHWLGTRKNPDYEMGLKGLSFESCLLNNKGNKKEGKNGTFSVQTKPKYLTQLLREKYDKNQDDWSGGMEVIETNSFKQANNRKIKALNRFCDKYQPLYQKKEVTLFFLTFTQMNKARLTWKTMSRIVVKYFERIGFPVRAFVWTLEVSENLHAHYHLCVAVNRMDLKGGKIPKEMKFNRIWGKRTEIDFVKKNVKFYLSKYFAKNNNRIEGYRSYGISKKLK